MTTDITSAALDLHIQSSTDPKNTGASEDACRLIRMLLELHGMRQVAFADMYDKSGFIAQMCRRVSAALASTESDQKSTAAEILYLGRKSEREGLTLETLVDIRELAERLATSVMQ